jgi:hypothetical protein
MVLRGIEHLKLGRCHCSIFITNSEKKDPASSSIDYLNSWKEETVTVVTEKHLKNTNRDEHKFKQHHNNNRNISTENMSESKKEKDDDNSSLYSEVLLTPHEESSFQFHINHIQNHSAEQPMEKQVVHEVIRKQLKFSETNYLVILKGTASEYMTTRGYSLEKLALTSEETRLCEEIVCYQELYHSIIDEIVNDQQMLKEQQLKKSEAGSLSFHNVDSLVMGTALLVVAAGIKSFFNL